MSTHLQPPAASADKTAWRQWASAARRDLGADDRLTAQLANRDHLLAAVAGARSVCVFAPLASEPLPGDIAETLAATGLRVLVPVTTRDQPLDWVELPTGWEPGPLGTRTPTGPRTGPATIADVDLVVVPAFAVDDAGYRLGRGGGYYDRSLALTSHPIPLVTALFDHEQVRKIPTDPHDLPVTAVIRPTSGLTSLPR